MSDIDALSTLIEKRWCSLKPEDRYSPKSSSSNDSDSNDSESEANHDFFSKNLFSQSDNAASSSMTSMNLLPPVEKEQFAPLMNEPILLIDGQMRWQLDQLAYRHQHYLSSNVPGKASTGAAQIQQLASLEHWPTTENYIVIGVLGKKGVGKSLLLNSLFHYTSGKLQRVLSTLKNDKLHSVTSTQHQSLTEVEKRDIRRKMVAQLTYRELNDPFPVAPNYGQNLSLKCCTRGVQMYASSEGLILLDVQPLLSMSLLAEAIRGENVNQGSGGIYSTNNNSSTVGPRVGSGSHSASSSSLSSFLEPPLSTQCSERNVRVWSRGIAIRFVSFLMNVCDAVLVVEDNACDYQLHRVINDALTLRPIFYRHLHVPNSTKHSSKNGHGKIALESDNELGINVIEHSAGLLFVYNKCPVGLINVEADGRFQYPPNKMSKSIPSESDTVSLSTVHQSNLYNLAEPTWRLHLSQNWGRQLLESVKHNSPTRSLVPLPASPQQQVADKAESVKLDDSKLDESCDRTTDDDNSLSHETSSSILHIPRNNCDTKLPIPLISYLGVPPLTNSDSYSTVKLSNRTVFESQIKQIWDSILSECKGRRLRDRSGKVIHMRRWVPFAGEVWKHILESPTVDEYLNLSPVNTD